MATKAREWPENAREARDLSSEHANKAIRALSPILERYTEMTKEELVSRVAIAINANQKVCRLLERLGAPTTPDNL